MAYQSIFTGGQPAVNPKAHLFDDQFTPGQYGKVNADIAAQQAAAAPPPQPKSVAPPSGPTGFWQRLGMIGVGKVNAYNAYRTTVEHQPAVQSNSWSQDAQVAKKAGVAGVNVGKTVLSFPIDVGKEANKNIVQPLIFNKGGPTRINGMNVADAQTKAQQLMNSGQFSQATKDLVTKTKFGGPSAYNNLLQAITAPGATDQTVKDAVTKGHQAETAQTKRMVGAAVEGASLGVGGGETASLVGSGIKGLARGLFVNAVSGASGNVGAKLMEYPNASKKELATSAGTGAAFGAGTALLGALGGKTVETVKTILGKDKEVNSLITNTAAKTALDKAAAAGKVPIKMPEDAGSKIPVAMPVKMQPGEYAARLNHLSNAYDTAQKQLETHAEKMDPVHLQALSQAVDNHFQQAVDRLNTDWQKGVLTKPTIDVTGGPKVMAANVARGDAASIEQPVSRGASKVLTEKTPAPAADVEKTFNNVKVAADKGDAKGSLKEVQSLFNPVPGNKQGALAKTTLRANLGEFNSARTQETIAAKADQKVFNKMGSDDHLKFIYNAQTGQKQSTPELQALADKYKKVNDENYKLATSLKPDLPYVKDYFTQSGILDPKAGEEFYNKWMKGTLGGKPGALEERHFPTVKELMDYAKANKIPVKETNPATLALNSRIQLLKAKMAQNFLEEADKKGIDPEVAQAFIDRHLERGFSDSKVFQDVKQGAYALNNLQLSLSGFHFTGTALNSIFGRFANGLKDVETLHPIKGAKNIVSSPMAPVLDSVFGRGMRNEAKAGITDGKYAKYLQYAKDANFNILRNDYSTKGLKDSLAQLTSGNAKETLKGVATIIPRMFSSTAKPLMEHWVPAIKAGAFKNGVDAELRSLGKNATEDQIRAAVQKVADSIDNRMGQLNQDNLMWSKWLKDSSSALMRSPGWNIGTVREVGGGVTNLLKPSTYKGLLTGKGLPQNTNYVAGLAGGTMLIGAVMQHLFTGKGPTSLTDYFYPKTGQTDKNGNPERVSLPTYAKDIFAFAHNPKQTIINKANPLISTTADVVNNRDYFGNMIRNPKDSLVTQGKQVADYLLKSGKPFSLSSSDQRVDKSGGAKAQSLFGLTPAPSYITQSALSKDVQARFSKMMGSSALTPEEQALNQEKSKARGSSTATDTTAIDNLVKEGKITPKQAQSLKADVGKSTIQRQFEKLPNDQKLEIIEKYTPDQLKMLDLSGLAKSLVDSNAKTTVQSLEAKGYSSDRIKSDLDKAGISGGQLGQIKANAKADAAQKARQRGYQPKWINPIR